MTSPPAAMATERRRLHWVDNLRVFVIAGVVVMHASTAYLGGADWYYEERTTSDTWSMVQTVPVTIATMPPMGTPFFIAGCTPRPLTHDGAPRLTAAAQGRDSPSSAASEAKGSQHGLVTEDLFADGAMLRLVGDRQDSEEQAPSHGRDGHVHVLEELG